MTLAETLYVITLGILFFISLVYALLYHSALLIHVFDLPLTTCIMSSIASSKNILLIIAFY